MSHVRAFRPGRGRRAYAPAPARDSEGHGPKLWLVVERRESGRETAKHEADDGDAARIDAGDIAAPPLCVPMDVVYCVNVLPFTRDQRAASIEFKTA